MTTITDEYMKQMSAKTKNYIIVLLKAGPRINEEEAQNIIWEHGRRNHQLRADGLLPIVCPIRDENIKGIGILNTTIEEAKALMDEDPGVKANIFVYELYPCRSFPGDCLPG